NGGLGDSSTRWSPDSSPAPARTTGFPSLERDAKSDLPDALLRARRVPGEAIRLEQRRIKTARWQVHRAATCGCREGIDRVEDVKYVGNHLKADAVPQPNHL